MNMARLFHDLILCRDLALTDLRTRYAGSILGTVWAFSSPLVTIVLFWFVFTHGLRISPVRPDVSFLVWFCAGIVPWFFFSEALPGAAWSYVQYGYLVKKVVFPIWVLPMVKVISALFVHAGFVLLLILLCLFQGVPLTWAALGVVYYSVCAVLLVVALGMASAALIPFFKDLGHIVSLVLQFGVWITPIFWDYQSLPASWAWVYQLNPVFYITEGYRLALLDGQWFWQDPWTMAAFWAFLGPALLAAGLIFRRMRRHLADVL